MVLYPALLGGEPMGRREIFLTFSLLVKIEGHITNEFVSYVYDETDDWIHKISMQKCKYFFLFFP
jgi:hypothetical protein